MTIYLRNEKGDTLLDVEVYKKDTHVDVSSVVNIKNYSKLLLDQSDDMIQKCITMFDNLSELRGWLWEVFFMCGDNTSDKYEEVIEELKKLLEIPCEIFDLTIVTD